MHEAKGRGLTGSDRVSALSKAFHHIFVAVCTPALTSAHSEQLCASSIILLWLLLHRYSFYNILRAAHVINGVLLSERTVL